MQAHGPQLLTAMIGGLDDRDDPHSLVALEAMVGLARLLELVKRQDLRSVLLHVAIRIRPFFDSVGRAGCRGSDRPVGLPPPPTPARRPGACSPGPRGPGHPHLHPTPPLELRAGLSLELLPMPACLGQPPGPRATGTRRVAQGGGPKPGAG